MPLKPEPATATAPGAGLLARVQDDSHRYAPASTPVRCADNRSAPPKACNTCSAPPCTRTAKARDLQAVRRCDTHDRAR